MGLDLPSGKSSSVPVGASRLTPSLAPLSRTGADEAKRRLLHRTDAKVERKAAGLRLGSAKAVLGKSRRLKRSSATVLRAKQIDTNGEQ